VEIKVRFAPSPTGLLHVGNVRIAILNYVFAKKNGGKFVLRIDDTDVERSTKESEGIILEDLTWLGIEFSEFYRQSERMERYRAAFERLKSSGRVYPCYETKEELSLKRKTQAVHGASHVYDRAALKLSDSQKKFLEESGVAPYWRFKLNETESVEWMDLVHGNISIPLNSVSDPVLMKPDGSFVYTFASVVDDIDIGITHIIRGDDHITNTAAQLDMFNALGGSNISFAHVPLLSSIDGQDVSKRTGSALSVVNIRKDGILPEALIAVLATLGTSCNVDYHDSLADIVEKFSFDNMSLSSPKFNLDDVKMINRKILAGKPFCEVEDDLKKLNLDKISEDFWDTVRGNINSIGECVFWHNNFFGTPEHAVVLSPDDIDFVQTMLDTLPNPIDFDQWIADLKKKSGRKGRDLFHPIRIAVAGLENGPELKKIIDFLGYDLVKRKIENSLRQAK
jgi:glutamyl-tRNA synthetase